METYSKISDHCVHLESEDERKKMATAIVDVMGNYNLI
jgi:hypothetical protein